MFIDTYLLLRNELNILRKAGFVVLQFVQIILRNALLTLRKHAIYRDSLHVEKSILSFHLFIYF